MRSSRTTRGSRTSGPSSRGTAKARSASLRRWLADRGSELDQLEGAHSAVGGASAGRRWTTQQINHAYAVLLCSQFQGFCRDLHSESVDHIVGSISPTILQTALRAEFVFARKLDRENPNPRSLGSDFNRLGLSFWTEVGKDDARNKARKVKLEKLNLWRNAIAHQDFDPARLGPRGLTLGEVRSWRRACDGLAGSFDRVLKRYLTSISRRSPW